MLFQYKSIQLVPLLEVRSSW